MSEAEHQATDILLPGARLSIFSQDEETLASAAQVKQDWRFARVDVSAVQGDVRTAIETFQNQKSPDLLIIQTDDINDEFTALLGELSAHCDEGTAAIVIGPVNDVYLYRQLIEMGVSDYLVRPIMPDVLAEVVAKALVQRLGVSDSRLIAFMGAKGGVGTSSFAQVAAWLMSEKLGQKTVLLDAAGGFSGFSVGMDFDPSTTLHEVAQAVEAKNEDALKRMFHDVNDKLSILATGSDAMLDASVSAQQYEEILDNLMVKSPVVFVDLSNADSTLKKIVISRAHKILTFTTPTLTSLRLCRTLIKEISDVRGGDVEDVTLMVNKCGIDKTHEVPAKDIAEALGYSPTARFDNMPSVFLKHESEVRNILSDKDAEPLINDFLRILQSLVSGGDVATDNNSDEKSGLLGGLLSKIKSK